VHEIAYSQARAELADLFDDALTHLPARITRRRAEPVVLLSLEDLRLVLERCEFTPEVLFEPSAVAIWLPELAIWGRGPTYDEARADLLDEVDQLLAAFAADARLRSAPNIVERLPWIHRLELAEDDARREAMIFAEPGGAPPSVPATAIADSPSTPRAPDRP
jgi:hypothetical protein